MGRLRLLRPIELGRSAEDKPLAKRGIVGLVGVGWQGGVRFLTNLMVGHLGGPILLGVVATAMSLSQIVTLLYPAGAGSAASKYVALTHGQRNVPAMRAVAGHLARRVAAVSVLLSIGGGAYFLFADGGSPVEAATVAILCLGMAGWVFVRGVLFGAGEVKRATILDVVTGAVGLLGVAIMLTLSERRVVAILPLALGYVVFALVSWPWERYHDHQVSYRREIGVFVILASVGTMASAGFLQLSLLVARAMAGREGAGQYAAAMTLATPLSVAAGALSTVLFPSLARSWGAGNEDHFKHQTNTATRLLALVLVPIVAVLAILREPIVALVWGERFNWAASAFPWLVLAIMVNGISVPAVNAITTVSQRGMWVSAGSSVLGATMGAGVWVLGSRAGLPIVPIGYCLGVVVLASIPFVLVWVRDGHEWTGVVVRVVGAIGALIALMTWQSGERVPHLLWSALAFVLSWAAVSRRDARILWVYISKR